MVRAKKKALTETDNKSNKVATQLNTLIFTFVGSELPGLFRYRRK